MFKTPLRGWIYNILFFSSFKCLETNLERGGFSSAEGIVCKQYVSRENVTTIIPAENLKKQVSKYILKSNILFP